MAAFGAGILAPTASTTAALAMGDALAMALLERRGFTADDFAVLHPGGRLGQKLLRVEDLMHRGDDLAVRLADSVSVDGGTLSSLASGKRVAVKGTVDAAGVLAATRKSASET